MNSLLDSSEDVGLSDTPSLSVYMKNFLPEVRKMVTESLPGVVDQTR